jgi:undecaprenyl-diphosphatase
MLLENVVVVATMLVLGGVLMLFVDKWFNKPNEDQTMDWKRSLKVGFFQCIAMIPGVSRSMATIVGGMTTKLTRKNAAEFSFFLAVPTMAAASGYKLLKLIMDPAAKSMLSDNLVTLLIGNLVAFVVAMAAIKFFIGFLTKYGFKAFGYYRIVVGAAILILIFLGVDLSIL